MTAFAGGDIKSINCGTYSARERNYDFSSLMFWGPRSKVQGGNFLLGGKFWVSKTGKISKNIELSQKNYQFIRFQFQNSISSI